MSVNNVYKNPKSYSLSNDEKLKIVEAVQYEHVAVLYIDH